MPNLNYQWYLKQNAKVLEQYAGEWVTIIDNHIAISGKNLKYVLEEADKQFPGKESFLVKVPEKKPLILS